MNKGDRRISEDDALEQDRSGPAQSTPLRIWHRLTGLGAMAYESVPSERQTRLLSSLLSVLVLLSFVATVVSLVTVPVARAWRDPDLLLVAAGLVLLTTAYGLNRAGRYRWAASLALLTSSISIFVTAVPQTSIDDTGLLLYLVVPALICSVLLPLTATAVLSAVQIVGVLLFAALVPMVTLADIIDYAAFILIVSGLVLVSARHRNQLEKDRQAKLEQSRERYRQYAARLEALRNVDAEILAARSSGAICASALQHIQSLIPAHSAQVLEIYPKSDEAIVLAARGDATTAAPVAGTHLWLDANGLLAELSRGGTYIIDEALDLPPASPTRQRLLSVGTRCMVAVPLAAQGQLIGALEVQGDRPGIFGPEHIEVIGEVADTLAVAIQQARLLERVQRHAGELEQRVAERTSELSAANAELARAARLKDEFLASMSHELRTPLNAILGLSEALRSDVYGPLNKQQTQKLEIVHQSGSHLLELINEVLDVARIGAGKVDLNISPVQVQTICQASLDLVKPIAQDKTLRISLTLDGTVHTIQADERRLKQILVNLLSNAVKFTPEGGAIGLETAGDAAARVVRFIVWDTGIGISDEGLEQLFQPFVQLDGGLSRRYQGTGLGLVLAYRMTELHGGSLAVESQEGMGSRFTVSLPWTGPDLEETESGLEREAHSQSVPGIQDTANGPLVLLAEDNEYTISAVSTYLQAHGYRVVVARDGTEAVAQAREFGPQVILMDIQMPRMDGIEAARRIRDIPEIAGTPIIAVTALSMPGDRERCLKAGMDIYLSKPVRLRRLLESIEEKVQ